jgi:acyl-CoA synthetase (AMP-forming)/AMP-acid ligase II
MRLIGDIVRLGAKRHPDREALISEKETVTYRQLNQLVNKLAHGLLSEGVRPGDRIALLGMNSINWIVANLAIAKCGGIVTALNFRYKSGELVYAINNSESSMLIYGPEFDPIVAEAKAEFGRDVKLMAMAGKASLTMTGLMEGRPVDEPNLELDPEKPVALTFTSGTTGAPKGVLMSHNAFFGIYTGLIVDGDMRHNEITLVSLPLFHSAGMHALVGPTLLMGGKAIIMTGGFDPDENLSTVARHGVTLTMWVPTQLAILVNCPSIGDHDSSSLTRIWYGASPISPIVLEASMKVFSAGFYQFYGQTEIGMATVLRPEDHSERSQMTGREMFNSEYRVVNVDGSDTPPGEIGEIIYAQKAHGMIGYYQIPEANRETIIDGWIKTGDLAKVEQDGFITIADRAKDMIISGAENIYPKEIEATLISHPAIQQVAVFGIPDDIYGEAVCAAAVLNEGYSISEQEIIDYCASKIARYKKPKKVDFVDALPMNSMGKVTKGVLREPYWVDRKRRI